MSNVTRILEAIDRGDGQAAEQLLPLVYAELRRLAAHKLSSEAPGQTLQPTALVHEAWLRLAGREQKKWNGQTHFFAAAAEAMRLILVDRARRKHRERHGGGKQRVELSDIPIAAAPNEDQLLAVNEALEKLAREDKPKADLVKLRYFVGLSIQEAAEILGISEGTAKRHWAYARAWLGKEIKANS